MDDADHLRHQRRLLEATAGLAAVFSGLFVLVVAADGHPSGLLLSPSLAAAACCGLAAVVARRSVRAGFWLLVVGLVLGVARAHLLSPGGAAAPVYLLALVGLASTFFAWRPFVRFGVGVTGFVVALRLARGWGEPGWFDVTLDLALAPLALTALLGIERWRVDRDRGRLLELLGERDAAVRRAEASAAEAVRANEAKSEFLARVSHELRTPLNAITGYTELVLEERPLDAATRDDLGRVLISANDLLALVDDVLDLQRVEAGRVRLLPTPIAIVELLAPALTAAGPLLARNGDTLTTVVPDARVTVDPRAYRQLLHHLLSNAARFTTNGRVVVRVTLEGDTFRTAVEDTGIGIRPERLRAVFEPFVQAEADTAARYGGTGLGLSIAARLARSMGGHVDVTSVVGVGSTFTIVLPRVAAAG